MKKYKRGYVEGSYNRCVHCEFLGKQCDGPRTSSMTLERWCEFCRALKEMRGLTNEELSEMSGVSEGTVDKIMAGRVDKDLYRSTVSMLESALIGSDGQFPCTLAAQADSQEVIKDMARKDNEIAGLRKALEEIHASYKVELDTIRAEAQKKIDYLKLESERKDKIIDRLLK